MIGRKILIDKSWDTVKQKFIKKITHNLSESLTLIDVGANIGLFSRQCLNILNNLNNIYLYEPHLYNFNLLKRNLSQIEKINFNNFGLGKTDCIMDFFLDSNNIGNY